MRNSSFSVRVVVLTDECPAELVVEVVVDGLVVDGPLACEAVLEEVTFVG